MSDTELAQKIAEMLKPTAENAAKAAVTSELSVSMKSLEDALGNKIETCIDGKCDDIATKTSERLQSELQKIKKMTEGDITVKGHTPHDLWDCPTCKPVAIDHLLKEEKHRSGLLETVCKNGVCKPIVAENLWKDAEYRKDVLGKLLKDETQRGSLLEGICTDETCRKDLLKKLKEKNIEVSESGSESERKDESWAQKRLRERREKAAA